MAASWNNFSGSVAARRVLHPNCWSKYTDFAGVSRWRAFLLGRRFHTTWLFATSDLLHGSDHVFQHRQSASLTGTAAGSPFATCCSPSSLCCRCRVCRCCCHCYYQACLLKSDSTGPMQHNSLERQWCRQKSVPISCERFGLENNQYFGLGLSGAGKVCSDMP